MKWTDEDDKRLADQLIAGKTSKEIAEHLGRGITRNAIIGRVHRCKHLAEIGFARTKPAGERGNAASSPRRDNVVTLNIPRNKAKPNQRLGPVMTVRAPLRVVSNNDAMMIDDWLRKHGGARRYETGFTADFYGLKAFLARHGIDLTMRNAGKFIYTIRQPDGRTRQVKWPEVQRFADQFRLADGLEPILAEARA